MGREIESLRLALRKQIQVLLPEDESPLSQAMRYSMNASGKLYRPLFAMGAGLAVGADPSELLVIGAALEFLHTFTLVHDDIMDGAAVRRGMPAVHMKWGTNLAILTGDALLAESLGILLGLKTKREQVLAIFITGLSALSRGQAIDLQMAAPQSDTSEYRRMAAWKTGTIFAVAGKMASVIANATVEKAARLESLGQALGIAYQIKDDYLDFFAVENLSQKSIGRDLALRKNSILISTAMSVAPDDFEKILKTAEADPHSAFEEAMTFFTKKGVQTEVLRLLAYERARCIEAVKDLSLPANILLSLIDEMLQMPSEP